MLKIGICMFTVIIISSLFFLLAKISLDNMISISPNLYKEVKKIMIMTGCFTFIIILISSVLVYSLRKTIVEFSDKMCETIDSIIEKKENIIFDYNEDTLLSKIQQKLKRLVEILNSDRNKANIEKENIKTLISDISHQIKTPIANISMYNETLIEREFEYEIVDNLIHNIHQQFITCCVDITNEVYHKYEFSYASASNLALLELETNDSIKIFGTIDSRKLQSCMTLFNEICPNSIFNKVLIKYFNGNKDKSTLDILKQDKKLL